MITASSSDSSRTVITASATAQVQVTALLPTVAATIVTMPPLPTALSANPVRCVARVALSKAVPPTDVRSGRAGADGEKRLKLKTES